VSNLLNYSKTKLKLIRRQQKRWQILHENFTQFLHYTFLLVYKVKWLEAVKLLLYYANVL